MQASQYGQNVMWKEGHVLNIKRLSSLSLSPSLSHKVVPHTVLRLCVEAISLPDRRTALIDGVIFVLLHFCAQCTIHLASVRKNRRHKFLLLTENLKPNRKKDTFWIMYSKSTLKTTIETRISKRFINFCMYSTATWL